jgi:glutathione synthase/RimK-type ligase-like ATP-grasp enzyme
VKRVGLLVGRERSFPDALIAEVARRGAGALCEYARVGATRSDAGPPSDVRVDRISHEVTCYQPYLKLAALHGTRVINDPFWRIADDKFYNAGLAKRLGLAVPKTVLLPSKSYVDGITSESLARNMELVDWDGLEADLGYPMYMKPHWGGGWRNVSCVASRAELLASYDASGTLTMIVQEAIAWTQYVRCIVVGDDDVLPALWDPRRSHLERYTRATAEMPALSPALEARVQEDALTISRALGYRMNTVEFAIEDGVPYAIDFMNSAPDFDVSSLGEDHFGWVTRKMADLVLREAHREKQEGGRHG